MGKSVPPIPIVAAHMRVTMVMTKSNATVSETHWDAATTDYNVALADAKILATARAAIMGRDAQLIVTRISSDAILRDSTYVDGLPFTAPDVNGSCDPKNRSVGLRLEMGSLNRVHTYIGMIPDDAIVNGKYKADAIKGFLAAQRTYFNILTGSGPTGSAWGSMVLVKDAAVCPLVAVVSAGPAGGLNASYTTILPHKLAVGDVVRVARSAVAAGFTPKADGLFVVNAIVSPFTFTVANPLVTTALKFVKGKARKQLKQWQSYDNWATTDVGYRPRGSRSFLPLGRRRARS